MNNKNPSPANSANRNDPRFVQYYAQESASERARERAMGIMAAVQRSRRRESLPTHTLSVADIGCNAGTQSRCWLDQGHTVCGLDIGRDLVTLARQRNEQFGARAKFEVGSATELPWPSSSFDVCLLPELLEHVDDWQSCLREGVRVLRPGGTLYLSTTNVLCPIQQEFTLPLYSWYPTRLKRHYERIAVTVRPEIVNFASYPAVHWFSPYKLGRFLGDLGLTTKDRFDLVATESKGPVARLVIGTIRSMEVLRFLGHVFTPSTVLVGHKLEVRRVSSDA